MFWHILFPCTYLVTYKRSHSPFHRAVSIHNEKTNERTNWTHIHSRSRRRCVCTPNHEWNSFCCNLSNPLTLVHCSCFIFKTESFVVRYSCITFRWCNHYLYFIYHHPPLHNDGCFLSVVFLCWLCHYYNCYYLLLSMVFWWKRKTFKLRNGGGFFLPFLSKFNNFKFVFCMALICDVTMNRCCNKHGRLHFSFEVLKSKIEKALVSSI